MQRASNQAVILPAPWLKILPQGMLSDVCPPKLAGPHGYTVTRPTSIHGDPAAKLLHFLESALLSGPLSHSTLQSLTVSYTKRSVPSYSMDMNRKESATVKRGLVRCHHFVLARPLVSNPRHGGDLLQGA